jgi:D-alanyl-D-alanine carboxypeptidase
VLVAAGLMTGALPSMVVPANGATPARAGIPVVVRASLRSELNNYLSTRASAEHISAVSLAVTFSGSRPGIDMAVGRNRYGAGSVVSPDELWQIGSNTKAFTSVLMLQLEAEHKLSIDDTLGKWLPQYPAWSAVTVKQLLDMTSGIPDYTTSNAAYWNDVAAMPNRKFSRSQLVSYVTSLAPTHGYSYSNTNYILAQMIIQRASGESYGRLLREKIFEPFGLRNTFYSGHDYPSSVTARMPAGYWYVPAVPVMQPQVGKDQRRLTVSWAQGAGAIVSSLLDLGKWDHELYTGQVLPARQQRELTSLISMATAQPIATTTLSDPDGYGLGVNQITNKALGTLWYYEGETQGYRVVNMYVARSGTAIAVGVNSATLTDNTGALATSLYETLQKAGLA